MSRMQAESDAAQSARGWRSWLRVDVLVAIVALIVLLPASIAVLTQPETRPDAAMTAVAIGFFAGLHSLSLLAVRNPLVALAVASAIMTVLALVPGLREVSAALFPSSFAYLLVLGQVALQCRPLIGVLALGSGVFGAAVIASTELEFHDGPRFGAFIGLTGAVSAAWAVGRLLRLRRTQAEEQMRAGVERAIAEERMRINRDLHDIVAHSMTVMIAQAEVARALLHDDPTGSDHALGIVLDTGRDALRGMRSVVADDGDAPLRPLPTVDSLTELVEAVRRPGSEVDFVEVGERAPLSPGAALALHHAVREALTNAVRHTAPPVRIDVRLAWSPAGLRATVTDDGGSDTTHGGPGGLGTGAGLIGIAERVRQAGGVMTTQEGAPRGWTVRIDLPVSPEKGVS